MNQLDELTVPSAQVEYQGKTLTVRGLTLSHITLIARFHGVTLERLYQEALGGKMSMDIVQISLTLADEFAPLAGKIIACGMGDPSQADRVSELLPAALQFELIEKIVELTLVENDGLGKTMEIITRLLTAMARLPQPQKT